MVLQIFIHYITSIFLQQGKKRADRSRPTRSWMMTTFVKPLFGIEGFWSQVDFTQTFHNHFQSGGIILFNTAGSFGQFH